MFFPEPPSIKNQFLQPHSQCLNASFQAFFDAPLLRIKPELLAENLFNAPFALLSHNTDVDPVFNYANQKALALFELQWPELIRLPSRLSAEPINQAKRDTLMRQVTTDGFIKNYEGIRISSQGRRFQIKQATIWNLTDQQGAYYGQAACFLHWHFL